MFEISVPRLRRHDNLRNSSATRSLTVSTLQAAPREWLMRGYRRSRPDLDSFVYGAWAELVGTVAHLPPPYPKACLGSSDIA